MSRENVEIVRRTYELWAGGDWRNLDLLAPDVTYRPLARFTEASECHGRDEFRHFLESFMEAWSDDFLARPTSFLDRGEAIVVRLQYSGHARASGVEIAERIFEVSWLADGKITRIEDFADRAEALEAVDLAE